MSQLKILIVGAGAIGRGYLPWIFDENTELTFVDKSVELIKQMKQQGSYSTYKITDKGYEEKRVNCKNAFLIDDHELQNYLDRNRDSFSAVFINVGPRAVRSVLSLIKSINAPLVLSENDPETVNSTKKMLSRSDVYFAVPDVITSNTAPDDIRSKDPLALITETGKMFIENGFDQVKGDFTLLSNDELLHKQWIAKLFLHNTPHCIAAYMGHLIGAKYVHQAMENPEIDRIVTGSMNEMLTSLKAKWDIPHEFLDWYALKELDRFRSKWLFDPIARVAREPLRKLELNGRLIGAAQICLAMGFIPYYLLLGITSALLFDDPNDNDFHIKFMRSSMPRKIFLVNILGLRDLEALTLVLDEHLDALTKHLEKLIQSKDKQIKNYELHN